MILTAGAIGRAVVAEELGTFSGSTDGSGGQGEGQRQGKRVEEEGLAASADVERQGSPVVLLTAGDTAKTGHPGRLAVAAGDGEARGRAAQALPLVRRRNTGGKLEEADAGESVWFDKTILRVGARVPWGRLHRGRFAKVSLPAITVPRRRR